MRSLRKNLLLKLLLLITVFPIAYIFLNRFGYIPPLNQMTAAFCLDKCRFPSPIHTPTPEAGLLNQNQAIANIINQSIDKSKTSILIEKSQNRLTLFYNQQPIKSYRVVFGGNPVGDKLHEGDRRTPEGIFRIQDLYPHPTWSKFMWLDYPNLESWQKHLQAKLSGKINLLLPIGGEVGIHGVPPGSDGMVDAGNNWTLGCPSLKNRDVEELYQVVQKGTLVEIIP